MMTSHRSDACFKAEYFDDIYEFETSNFWFQNRNELIIWALAKYFPTIDSFLEIGCGTGFVLSEIEKSMPDLSLTGIDLFAEGLLKARQRVKRAALIEQDARQLTLDADFDVSGAFDVLEHIDEDELVLRELFRVCRQGLLITVPQHKFLWSAVDEYSCHKRRYSRKELIDKVTAAGFRVVYANSFMSLLMPVLAGQRIRKKKIEELDPLAEIQLNPAVNGLLSLVSSFERRLIKAGMKFPFGGSLLLVAQKN